MHTRQSVDRLISHCLSLELSNDSKVLGHADTIAGALDSDADVAVLAPGCAPRVTHDPVLIAGIADAPTDHVDSVVNAVRAASGVQNTA